MSKPKDPDHYVPSYVNPSYDEVLDSLWKSLSTVIYGSEEESLILLAICERETDLRNDRLGLPRKKRDGSRVYDTAFEWVRGSRFHYSQGVPETPKSWK